MKSKILFGGALLLLLMLMAGCDPNPFAAPGKKAELQTQNTVSEIETDQVKLPDETATGEVLIPQSATRETVAADTAGTEQTVTFNPKDSTTAKLAKCLTQKGVRMYGAYWCPHCQDQKAMFGDDFHLITYFECDPKGPNSQAAKCTEDKISSYPTWYFPKSGYNTGTKELERLAALGGCEDALK